MSDITLVHYLYVSFLLFGIGLLGIVMGRKSILSVLMSLEIMLLSVNINMIAFSAYLKDLVGQLFTLFILTVAAAEAAIGLALLVLYHRHKGSVHMDDIRGMRG